MTLTDARTHVEIIDRGECIRLLATQEVGRIGFVNGDTPEILPVNYAVDGDAIVFATASGTKLWSAQRGRVTFEVDCINPAVRSGWSVVIHGFAQEITSLDSPAVVARLRALSLHPWASGERPHLVRIPLGTITGRRVGPGPSVATETQGNGVSTDNAALTHLDRDDCLALLRTQSVGRIAIALPDDAPLVVPVNYMLDGEFIVFRSEPGTKLRSLQRGPVSFQVDFIDWHHRTGWSVLGRGRAYEATHAEVDHLLLESWVEGDKRHWVRVALTDLTGRRLNNVELEFPPHKPGYL